MNDLFESRKIAKERYENSLRPIIEKTYDQLKEVNAAKYYTLAENDEWVENIIMNDVIEDMEKNHLIPEDNDCNVKEWLTDYILEDMDICLQV